MKSLLGESMLAILGAILLAGCGETAALSAQPSQGTTNATPKQTLGANPPPSEIVEQINKQSDEARIHEDRARNLMRKGDLSGAEAEVQQAIKLHPRMLKEGDPWLLQLLAEVRIAQNRPQEAVRLLQSTFKSGGAAAVDVRLDTALAFCMTGDLASAQRYYVEKDLEKYVGADAVNALPSPNTLPGMTARTRFALAMFYLGRSQDDEALPHLQAAARLAPANAEVAYQTARVLTNVGKHAQALRMLRRVQGGKHTKEAKAMADMLEQEQKESPKDFNAEKDLRTSIPSKS